jgi:glutathione peroxidase
MTMTARLATLAIALLPLLGLAPFALAQGADDKGVYNFTAKDIDGNEVPLSQYKGKVLLIVNTASKCGYTPQYKGMEAVYEKYKDKGLEVLAFPANEFGAQEPGSNSDIKTFCTSNYKTTFPLFSKIVVKGQGQHPLYQYLTSNDAKPIPWNFTKFLVSKDGKVIERFEPKDTPEGEKVTKAVEDALAK